MTNFAVSATFRPVPDLGVTQTQEWRLLTIMSDIQGDARLYKIECLKNGTKIILRIRYD
jgi:hypothetical protein